MLGVRFDGEKTGILEGQDTNDLLGVNERCLGRGKEPTVRERHNGNLGWTVFLCR